MWLQVVILLHFQLLPERAGRRMIRMRLQNLLDSQGPECFFPWRGLQFLIDNLACLHDTVAVIYGHFPKFLKIEIVIIDL